MIEELDKKLNNYFSGKVVRKDLTKLIKEGQNVPIYVLEYLLGMYCATDNDEQIEEGLKRVKSILGENYVRPDEAEKIKSKIREIGTYSIIDKLTVKLDEKKDIYVAQFSNLGIAGVGISPDYIKKYEKLLAGGIWCILQMDYFHDEANTKVSAFQIRSLKPIQIPNVDINDILENRKNFDKDEWINVLLRSVGLEPTTFETKAKWHLLERLVPFVENNYNLCELGPRNTGKSYVYKEISPNSILVSGGQTTVPNLFYNMSTRTIGLVGLWDVVAFDEVAGITFKEKDGIQIMKDYMSSGSFSRGKEQKNADASIVMVGNVNQSIETLVKTSHLFAPFPDAMSSDTAFFDRIHYYIPGWEIPKFKPEFFTNKFGFIVDYIAEFFREMRKRTFADVIYKYFKIGNNLNQRDVIAVKKTFSGLAKLLYPDGDFGKDEAAEILEYALEGRRRVKEQLKKIGGMEFYDVHFSYIDNETLEENFVSLSERGSSKLIPEENNRAGTLYSVMRGSSDMVGVYKIETQVVNGNGKFSVSGLGSSSKAKENVNIAFNFFKANAKSISTQISIKDKDHTLQFQDLQGVGMGENLTLIAFIALCSGALQKTVQNQMVILGSMSIGGTITKVESLADILQVCFDAGAKKILLPMSSAKDISTVPAELFSKFNTSFYQDPVDAVYKALGVS